MRTTSMSCAVVGLIAMAALLWPSESQAGYNAASGFDMGAALGVASYQAAVGQTALAQQYIGYAQEAANRLSARRLLGRTNISSNVRAHSNMHNGLVTWRGRYEDSLRERSNNAANAYRLGLLLGLAEGQCTSPVWGDQNGAWQYAHRALNQARELLRSSALSGLRFDRQLLDDAVYYTNSHLRAKQDAYQRVVRLRLAYRDVVNVSNY